MAVASAYEKWKLTAKGQLTRRQRCRRHRHRTQLRIRRVGPLHNAFLHLVVPALFQSLFFPLLCTTGHA